MPYMTQALLKPSSAQKKSAGKAFPDSSAKASDQLKNRFEQMSGLSFKEVQIHYSSSKPAAVGAQAYAAGNHVYLGPGQERCLPHELGHVLQQKQGRVQPTMQLGDARINCDAALEHEADMLGRQAMQGRYGMETPNPSRENGASEVVQCHGFFSEKLARMKAEREEHEEHEEQSEHPEQSEQSEHPENPENLIDEILSVLGIVGKNAEKLKNSHMNFNQMNVKNILASGSHNIYDEYSPNTNEATIEDFIRAQLDLIRQCNPEDIPLMQMGAVLNGISRMLAHKLGDMSASDKILEKIMQKIRENFPDAQDVEEEKEENILREKINAFARGNPILMYLHSEINSHDASVMLMEQTRALGRESEEVFSLVQEQALIQIKAMRQLEDERKNVSAANTRKLAIADPIGLYSKNFIGQAVTEQGGWSRESEVDINKLHGKFINMPEATQMGKYQGNPTLEKARRHEEKSYQGPRPENPDGERKLKEDLREKAKEGVKCCCRRERLSEPENGDAGCFEVLDHIVNLLQEAPVVITRFASDLLARELSPSLPQNTDRALKPGTPLSYISLEELIGAEKDIRRHRPRNGEGPEIAQKYTLARSTQAAGDFSYTALLSEDSEEGRERGISYPVFRSNKNRLYAGKQQDALQAVNQQNARQAVFGTLNLLGEHNYHGLNQGREAGTYGDVVMVFRKDKLQNCMYTLGDRMRGYTRLDAFVYNAFALYGDNMQNRDQNSEQNGKTHFERELLVPKRENSKGVLPIDLIYLARDKKVKYSSFEELEVQIFDTVKLNRDFISEVYFASSVSDEQRDAIKNAIAGAPAADGQADTMFYQYIENECKVRPHLPMDYLYDKTSGDKARTKMTIEQVKQVLNAPNYEEMLRDRYGFHAKHTWKSRTEDETRKYQEILEWFRTIKGYMAEHGGDLQDQELEDIINGRVTLRSQLSVKVLH